MTSTGYMDSRYKRESAALAAMEDGARRGLEGCASPALLAKQRRKVRELREEHKARRAGVPLPRAGEVLARAAVLREVAFEVSQTWPTTPAESIPSDAAGVIVYDAGLDAIVCVPCQRLAGGVHEFTAPRPASAADMRRLGCCSSCGRDFGPVLAALGA